VYCFDRGSAIRKTHTNKEIETEEEAWIERVGTFCKGRRF
jgi:hypothetical protein